MVQFVPMKKDFPSRGRFGKSRSKPESKYSAPKSSKKLDAKGPSPIPTKAPGEFPMRINKYLAWKGFATRRDADTLVQKKQVTINERFAVLGDQVTASDVVEVRKSKKADSYLYYAYNKPRGISSEPNRKNTPDVSKSIPLQGVFPVGGLDTNAEGLLVLTNDRRIIDRLLNPGHPHIKEYLIQTRTPLRANFKEKMESGVTIGGSQPIHCTVKIIRENLFSLRIAGNDGYIRQMCSMFFAEVSSLKRTDILNISLGSLAPNGYRKIEGIELQTFLQDLGL